MPYIKENRREKLDKCIKAMTDCLCNMRQNTDSVEEILGDLNYVISRILAQLMGRVSYNKIAMITGVLENIKQEFYRRVAQPYEDKKILENGDIKEYKAL
jgi:hypothetical protein